MLCNKPYSTVLQLLYYNMYMLHVTWTCDMYNNMYMDMFMYMCMHMHMYT